MDRKRALREFFTGRPARVGAILVALYVAAAAFADFAPRGPREISQDLRLQRPALTPRDSRGERAPSRPLGTDELGRDVMSRVLHGARMSLLIGLLSVGVALLIGVPMGLAAGEAGGVVDGAIMRVVDVMLAFPGILLAIALMAVLGPSVAALLRPLRDVLPSSEIGHLLATAALLSLVIGVVNVPVYARQVRASVLQIRGLDYVVAARALGAGRVRVVLRHILPNVLAPVLVLSTLGVGTAILEAAGLGFVGLGLEPDVPEWGTMLANSRKHFLEHPWTVVAPGVAITVAILGFNLLGDALRDWMDPRSRRR